MMHAVEMFRDQGLPPALELNRNFVFSLFSLDSGSSQLCHITCFIAHVLLLLQCSQSCFKVS